MKKALIIAFILPLLISFTCIAQNFSPQKTYKHSVDFSPLSPFIGIYAIHYCYRFSSSEELILAPLYMNIHYKDIGNTDAPGFIIGYRHYIWKTFHIDYQLMPAWDHFYEKNENKRYSGFDLWNELRVGYIWNFNIGNVPAFVNFQWPLGFALYSEDAGKPKSFKKNAEKDPLFYFPPLFFTGVRF